jgi:protein gp37
MSDGSKIEWTDATWNPVRARHAAMPDPEREPPRNGWYCEHVSPGCEHCYAETMNNRLGTGLPFKPGHRKDVEIYLDAKTLLAPHGWKKPRMIFVCSMTDLFGEWVTDEWIDRIFTVMALCPQHTFQVLTKRPDRMREYFRDGGANTDVVLSTFWQWPFPNVWLGVSAEDQQRADERIPVLLDTPAAVKFVSLEPLLGPIDLVTGGEVTEIGHINWLRGHRGPEPPIPRLDWVIVGGESGPGARPMHPDWARSLRGQCKAAGVPFFFKQWGSWKNGSDFASDAMAVLTDGRVIEPNQDAMIIADRDCAVAPCNPTMMRRIGKKAAGRQLDGVEHNAMPQR